MHTEYDVVIIIIIDAQHYVTLHNTHACTPSLFTPDHHCMVYVLPDHDQCTMQSLSAAQPHPHYSDTHTYYNVMKDNM